ncbi:TIGR00730 family Rossman fold protein [Microbacterium capsulatum]|uniref:TIGR00730 family Rossman fold protein n=1 Tax=Microbacterium capsulatum TaxID=3041921 RepID=A0ABU0XB98_9MICO|nr:TIGR00730 family Rossman fold protein [Microbacterium sp. ASV81]MDQ4212379.1 TIGR00730 family Rossman fold protein [Microbacterium sp. ASV81]
MIDELLPPALRSEINAVLDDAGVHADRRLVMRMMQTAVLLGEDGTDRLDLKIASAALSEMRDAFRLFAPFQGVPKVTVFGSARTAAHDPLYQQARAAAAALAADGWMVVTGAGPGIMQAAAEGAGPQHSLGVSIRLPFEEKANAIVNEHDHVVAMKYFFTRKLMLMKESRGFICLPGGFGTLDEMFELLTLQQTGKAEPMPIVLLDQPGGTFWHGLQRFIREDLSPTGVISPGDFDRVQVTDSVTEAAAVIKGFWRNYDSLRWVGDVLVLRLRAEPTDAEVAGLNEQFGPLLSSGRIQRSAPLPAELADKDALDLPRLTLHLDQRTVGSLFRIIAAINALGSAPVR